MAEKRLVIVHGYTAAPEHHWFPWLKQQAEQSGLDVTVPRLPDSLAPQPKAWLDALEESIGEPDENSWLVGHSLGCITLLNYLTHRYPGAAAGGLLLVSGFSEPVPGLETLNSFTRDPVHTESIIARIPMRVVLGSLNDEIVPPLYSLRLSQQLSAPFYALPDHGHFLARDGVTQLPLMTTLLSPHWQK